MPSIRLCLLSSALCLPALLASAADVTVAPDGSADYRTIQAAIDASPRMSSAESPWTILVKPGTYRERLYIQREKRGLRLVGESPAAAATTIITRDIGADDPGPDGLPIGTYRTPVLQIDPDDFLLENITIENHGKGHALTIRVDGDRAVFRNCRFTGLSDAVFLNRGRQYFERCAISGAGDFIFGGATAWFENCDIISLASGHITAASTPKETAHGFVFSRCRLAAAAKPGIKSALGRPWRDYASVVFMNCEMAAHIIPEGWNPGKADNAAATTRYAEYRNTGPGAATAKRVAWSRQLTDAAAAALTPAAVLGGADGWNPAK